MSLPREWMRGPQWASPESRAEWEPILKVAQRAWEQLEALSVSEGLRPSSLLYVSAEEIVQATREAASKGFALVPLAFRDGQFRAAFTKVENAEAWVDAWTGCDDEQIGKLLGYPECCRRHFTRTWARGTSDTVMTIARYASTATATESGGARSTSSANVNGPPEANLLLRHIGVRLVPHLPCSPMCKETVAFGRNLVHVAAVAGVNPTPLYRLLNLPVTYSALHGVAVIETPHFRLWAGTDYTPDAVRITRAETKSEIAHLQVAAPEPATTWEDNGFVSREAMDVAHDVVLEVVRATAGEVRSALDLGCGDGALLAKIAEGCEGRWVGVERDHERLERGRQQHNEVTFHEAEIASWIKTRAWVESELSSLEPFDVALLMPGRLLEMTSEDADRVRRTLPKLARHLVVYAYDDMLKKYESASAASGGGTRLACLAREADLRVTGHVHLGSGVEATKAEMAPLHHGCGAHQPVGSVNCDCHHHDNASEVAL